MATIHKLTKDGSTIFPATITDAIVHPNTGKTLTSMIKDYNVSELFPSEGLDGGNKYNLALAIQVLGTHLTAAEKTGGIKVTFISSVSPYPEEEYYLNKNVWSTTLSDWGQRFEVGGVIANPSGSWEPGTAEEYIDQQTAILTSNLAAETIGRQTVDSNLQTQINSEVSIRSANDTTQNNRLGVLEEAYRNLTESDIIVGPRPTTGQQANVIYREPDQDHTPPQFYCDYMWYGDPTPDWVLMAQYDNGIDDNPLPTSNNLVKSKGVFNSMGAYDISADHSGQTYPDLTTALNAVPSGMRAGGMSVKFIQEITPAQYTVVKTENLTTEPTGTALSTDPNIVSGTYTAAQLNNLNTASALPSTLNSSKTYYLEVSTGNYTSWVVTYVQTSDNKYVQYRLMDTSFSLSVSHWQGVDAYPVKDSKNFVLSDGIKYDETLALANNSFYQVREVDTFDRIKWISAFTDVRVSFDNFTPEDYPDIKVAISLVRRKTNFTPNGHEIRLKIKYPNSDWTYLYIVVDEIAENENGSTPYKGTYIGNNSITLTCNVNWSVFNEGFSEFVDGDGLTSEPYFILKPSNIYLSDIDTLSSDIDTLSSDINNNQNNIYSPGFYHTFVPQASIFMGSEAQDNQCVFILKTPYKFSDNKAFDFEIIARYTSYTDTVINILKLSFWARSNNTFNYGSPKFYWTEGKHVPVRLCTDSEGYVCIAIGSDSTPIKTLLGINLTLCIKKVGISNFKAIFTPIKTGYTFSDVDVLSESYSNIYSLTDGNAESREDNGYILRSNNKSSITPLVNYYLNNRTAGEYKIKVKLPDILGNCQKLTVSICSSDFSNQRYAKADIEYWQRSINTSSDFDYGVCYKDPRFNLTVRLGSYNGDKYLLLNGIFGNYSRIVIDDFTVFYLVSNIGDYFNSFEFSTYTDEELESFSTIYTPISYTYASAESVNVKQDNIDRTTIKTFVPQCAMLKVHNPSKNVYVFKTPYKFSDNSNIAIEIGAPSSGGHFLGYKTMQVAFWARNNNTFNYYTPRFQWSDNNGCPVRLCTDSEGYICIALGDDTKKISNIIGQNPLLHVKKVSINKLDSTSAEARFDGWTVTGLDELTSDYSNIYAAVEYKTATKEYVDDAIANINFPSGTQMPIKPKSFALFGSSKTTSRYSYDGWWSYLLKGLLMNANYTDSITTAGTVTNRPSNGKTFTNGATAGKKITGVGSSMEFDVYGSHIDIVQMIERTTDYAEFDIYDGTTKIGSYNNRNKTMLGTKTQTFTGTGSQKSFVIDHLDSYEFTVTVDGVSKTVSMNPALTDAVDCFAVRTIMTFAPYNDGEPRRILYFPTAPANGAVISVSYSVGHVIGFTQSDYNENDSGSNESTDPISITNLTSAATYRNGYPLSPVLNNPNAVIRMSFSGYGLHHIKIVLTGGINPYFDFDFACAELNDFMNAAFGGYDIPRVISQSEWHDWRCIRYLPDFDTLFLEYGTNDDRYEIDRIFVSEETYTLAQLKEVKMKDVVYITNNNNTSFITGLCTGTIEAIDGFSLTSNDIKNSDIAVGDYIKIGEYHSDWREFTVRKVKTVDKTNGIVTWDKPFRAKQIWHYKDFADMVGAQFSVRRLGEVKTNYSTICEKFATTNPTAQLFIIGMSAFNNNDYCSGWGYNEAQQDIAEEYHGTFINIADEQVRFNDGGLDSKDAITVAIASTGSADYEVAASSIGNLNRAMRVIVNGQDVTGIDAFVERTDGWHVSDDVVASTIGLTTTDTWNKVTTFSTDYNNEKPVKIHFYQNVPTSNDTIQLLVGGYGWSNDGVHQTVSGNQTYGSCVLKAITQ